MRRREGREVTPAPPGAAAAGGGLWVGWGGARGAVDGDHGEAEGADGGEEAEVALVEERGEVLGPGGAGWGSWAGAGGVRGRRGVTLAERGRRVREGESGLGGAGRASLRGSGCPGSCGRGGGGRARPSSAPPGGSWGRPGVGQATSRDAGAERCSCRKGVAPCEDGSRTRTLWTSTPSASANSLPPTGQGRGRQLASSEQRPWTSNTHIANTWLSPRPGRGRKTAHCWRQGSARGPGNSRSCTRCRFGWS